MFRGRGVNNNKNRTLTKKEAPNKILRPGPITPEMLKKFGKIDKHQHSSEESSSLTSPGQLDSHYAPNTPLKILNSPEEFDLILLKNMPCSVIGDKKRMDI